MDLNSKEFLEMREKALRILARRDHSVLELRLKLKQKVSFDSETFKNLVNQLKDNGYLAEDSELVNCYIQKWRKEGRGRQWISSKLRLKGLPQIGLQDDLDEIASARRYLEKKTGASTFRGFSQVKRTKVANALVRRGFTTNLILALIKEKNQE